jgi:hypothetical protein
MANPHIVPSTFEQLYLVPASGYHFKPSRAKVIPITTAAVQPSLVDNTLLRSQPKLANAGHKAAVTTILILSISLVAFGCFAIYKQRQDQK